MTITSLSAGLTYRFSVSTINSPDESQTVDVEFESYDFVDVIEGISNLRCAATGYRTWNARDLDLIWDEPSIFSVDHYRVDIYDDPETSILPTEKSQKVQPRLLYTLEMNAQDYGAASNSVKVKVTAVDRNGNEDSSAITTFTNPLPDMSAATPSTQAGPTYVQVSWNHPTGDDLSHYVLLYDTNSPPVGGHDGCCQRRRTQMGPI